MSLPRQRMLRQLEQAAISLLAQHRNESDFWQAYSRNTAPLFSALSPGDRSWLSERLDSTLAIHGLSGCSSILEGTPVATPSSALMDGGRRRL